MPDKYRLKEHQGYWYIFWSDGRGSRRRSTGCRDRAEAQSVFDSFLASVESVEEPEKKTVAVVISGYLQDRKGSVADFDRLERAASHVTRHLGWMDVDTIRPTTSTLYRRRRQDEGVVDGTIRRELDCVRAALNWAAAERWIDHAPKIVLPPPPPPRDRWLTDDEIKRLRSACATPHIKLFVEIALNTGARKGSIGDLTWSQVDFDARLIDFNPRGRRQTSKGRPVVPINETLLVALKEAAEIRRTDWVVEWAGKKAGNIKKAFERACKRAGLEGVTPHVLRHTAATRMAMAGVSMFEIAKMLGHNSSVVTERVYAKHSPGFLRGAADKLG